MAESAEARALGGPVPEPGLSPREVIARAQALIPELRDQQEEAERLSHRTAARIRVDCRGNAVTRDQMLAKLELTVDTAAEIWDIERLRITSKGECDAKAKDLSELPPGRFGAGGPEYPQRIHEGRV